MSAQPISSALWRTTNRDDEIKHGYPYCHFRRFPRRQPHIGTNIQLRLVLHLNPIAFVEVSRIPYLGDGDLLLVVIEFGGARYRAHTGLGTSWAERETT